MALPAGAKMDANGRMIVPDPGSLTGWKFADNGSGGSTDSGGGSAGSSSGYGGSQDPNVVSNPNSDTPNIQTTRDANGNLVFTGGAGTGVTPYSPSGGGAGGWNSGSDLPTGTYQNGYSPGGGGYGGGGGGGYGIGSGSSGQAGGYSQGLQQYPNSPNTYNQSTMGAGGIPTMNGASSGKQGGSMGSTTQGASNTGYTGGAQDPNAVNNYTKPYGGGAQQYMAQTGFNSGMTAGQMPTQANSIYGNFLQQNQDPSNFMTGAGFQAMQAGNMPNQMQTLYQNVLNNPLDSAMNPAYQEMQRAGQQATERQMLSQGKANSGNILAELQKTGMGIAGQYMPQIASMYGAGAADEQNRYTAQMGANTAAGNLGISAYNATGQNLGQGAQQEASRYTGQMGANAQLGQLGNNAYNTESGDQFNRTLFNTGQMNASTNNAQLSALRQQQNYQNQMTMNTMPTY